MTTGVDIVGLLLREHAPLVAIVPIERIKAGALPDGVELPALLIRRVSKVSHQQLKRSAKTRKVDRVSVTVRAANYRDQVAVIAIVEDCCSGVVAAEIAGGESVAIRDAGTGPDLLGPGASFEQAQDFRVSYDA